MSKFSVKNAFSLAHTELVKWITDARMIVVLCLMVFINASVVDPIKTNAELMSEPMNVFEPFIATLNSGMVLLIVPLGFITLISDFPKIDGNAVFFVFRIGKKSWLCGQILLLVLMILLYISAIFIAVVMPVMNISFLGTEWSLVATKFVSRFPEQSSNFGVLLLPENLYHQMTLPAALVQSTLFVSAYLLMLGMILLAFTIAKRKTAGFIVCGLIISFGAVFCSIRTELMWIFPMSHSIVWLHYTEFLREPIFPILGSAIYFLVIIALLMIFCILSLKRFDYDVATLGG